MKEELKQLGLTENEATVYLALLELGSTSAGNIIKKTKLHRNIVYDNLEKLIDKGLVTFVLVKKIKYFETTNPRELKEFIEKKKKDILDKEQLVKKIIPEIEKKRTSIIRKQEATIFKGKKSLKTILEEITRAKDEILVFGTGYGMRESMPIYYKQWHLKLKENKAKPRILLPINKRGNYLPPFKAKYLPEKNIMPSTICVFENKVLNIIWEDFIGILIISDKVANSYKNYFNLLWKIAEK